MSYPLNIGITKEDANAICEAYEAQMAKANVHCDEAYAQAEEQFQQSMRKLGRLLLPRLAAGAAHAVTAEQPHMMDDRPLEPVE